MSRRGQDAANCNSYRGFSEIDFIWGHPPYWRQIVYSRDFNFLSQSPTLDDFLDRRQLILRLSKAVLSQHGKIAILIGGYSGQGHHQPLVERAIREGLWPACTEIIRMQHGNTSSRKSYRSSFIPGLHDTCLVFESID